uniref:Uncharacterized protein n=1 Tax=Oryza sativa subsp. japonica TaxID=39947 RepID=Q6ZKZ2_ORYSJ|nr:hypothetical protein [Oryza sativa Japonica Group]
MEHNLKAVFGTPSSQPLSLVFRAHAFQTAKRRALVGGSSEVVSGNPNDELLTETDKMGEEGNSLQVASAKATTITSHQPRGVYMEQKQMIDKHKWPTSHTGNRIKYFN